MQSICVFNGTGMICLIREGFWSSEISEGLKSIDCASGAISMRGLMGETGAKAAG
jgi:hypothetical protein